MNRVPLKKFCWIGVPWDGNATQKTFTQLSQNLPGIYSLLEFIFHLVWRDCAPFLTFITYHLSLSILLSSGHGSAQSGLFSFCNWITEGEYKISTVTTSDFLRGDRKHQWNHSIFLGLPAAQTTDWVLTVRCTEEANTKWNKYIYWIHFLIIAFFNHGVLLPEILKGTVVLTFLCCFPVGCLSSQSRHHT